MIGPGEAAVIPSWVPHRVIARNAPGFQVDVFCPPRQGLLDLSAQGDPAGSDNSRERRRAWPSPLRLGSSTGPASAKSSTGSWRRCARVRARSWSSEARRASARRRCSGTSPSGIGIPRRPGRRAWRRRWSCRSPGSISCARRCSTGSTRCPQPQQDALNVALGLASGDVPDRFLVGLAVLGLLSAAAEERPLLCLVEDAQWLDAASGLILGFVARRLLAESVAIVVAVREPNARHDFDGLPELVLRGLADEDARTLLAQSRPGSAGRPRPRSDRRRDPRQPARAARAAAGA